MFTKLAKDCDRFFLLCSVKKEGEGEEKTQPMAIAAADQPPRDGLDRC
ncbi:MAG TPA: hypothetical protein VH594_20850 [Trebonia sp.]|jgi:hypothetical protein